VAGDVGERLLNHPVHRRLLRRSETLLGTQIDVKVDREAGAFGDVGGEALQGRGETNVVEHRGTQIEGQLPGAAQRVDDQIAQLAATSAGVVDVQVRFAQ